MMGLLDQVTDDPSQMGLLSMGLRLMSTPGKFGTAFGQAGLGALDDVTRQSQLLKEQKRRDDQVKMQREQFDAQQAQIQQAAARQQLIESAYRSSVRPDGKGGMTVDQTALIQSLMGADPVAGAKMAMPKPRQLMSVSGDSRVIDEASGETVVPALPKEKTPDAFDVAMQRLGILPGTPQYLAMASDHARKMTTHAPAASASVVMKQEGEEAKVVGKGFGEQYMKIQDAGMGAQKTIARADQFASLLDGVNTGKLTPVGAEVAAYAQSLGMKIDPKLGNKQAAEALSNQMALELRNPAGGAGMPGAMSDQDRSFLKNMTANIGKTPEANAMILDATRKLAKRDQEVAALARTYRIRKGSLDEGFYNELDAFSKANPLFTQPLPAGGKLTPAEQAELAALRARLGGK